MATQQINSKVMVITGASSGIGRATALEFARQGGSLILAARREEALEELASDCQAYGVEVHVVPTDVAKEEDINHLAQEAYSRFGKIDVWLNNAAVASFGHFDEIPSEDFRKVIDTNLMGYVYGARAATRQFKKQGYGILINISSMVGIIGQPYSLPYSISKFGIRGLGISLDQELKNEKNIHVCTVAPAVIDTPIFNQAGNYMGQKVSPPDKAIPASEVADKILALIEKPQQEVLVGSSALKMKIGRQLFPGLFDRMFRKMIRQNHFEDEPSTASMGNLFESDPEHATISGGWLPEQKQKNKKSIKLAGGIALLAGAIVGVGMLIKEEFKIPILKD